MTVKVAQVEQCSAVINLLTAALITDPLARWKYTCVHDYMRYEPEFYRAFGGASFDTGTAFVADELRGAALWLTSESHSDETAMATLAEATLAAAKRDHLNTLFERLAVYHPAAPHWYLPIIGVDPLHQGKNIGLHLMQAALDVCDEQQLIAYLDSTSERSVRFYQRLGFTCLGEVSVADSPGVFPMLRQPRALGECLM